MTKIQKTLRKDETTIYSIYLPVAEVQAAELQKGDEVLVSCKEKGKLEIIKQ